MLHFGFTLYAPPTCSPEQILDVAQYARRIAQALGFTQVEPVIALKGEEIEQVLSQADSAPFAGLEVTGWVRHVLLRDSDQTDYETRAVLSKVKYLQDEGDEEAQVCLPPTHLIGFCAQGGRGCTKMRLLFVQYPPEVCFDEERLVYGWWAEDDISFATAFTYGEEHFVQCYLRHVMLFKAIKRRYAWLKVQVDDPTRYWRTGSLDSLLRKTSRLYNHVLQGLFTDRDVTPKGQAMERRVCCEHEILSSLLSRN